MEEFSIPILEQTEEQIKMQIELLLEEYYEMDSVDLEGYTKQDAFLLCFQTLTKSYPMNLERNLFSKIIEWKYFLREKTFFMNINKDDSKMMIGIGDGIFQFQNKYYIIDWKTNFFANYTYEDGYKKVISEYSDQFMIYSANLRRHFIEINSEEKWDQVFGGMLFVFMRVEGEQGVVIVKPSLKEIDLYREKLKWRI
jgi:ATP-dependent exoDNAse (exonuclease V) beta subunit